jgi:drug/metabolite transporter (DMT)-like permease
LKDRHYLADASLVLVTLIWGTTFVVVKLAVETTDPAAFVAARFGIGTLALGALYWRRVCAAGWHTVRAGAVLGLLLSVGFLLQTEGLRMTTPARAGFITGLSVVLVPAIEALALRMRLARPVLLGVLMSALGLAVLSAPLTGEELQGGDWTGDLLVLGCALAFAMHIVGVGRYAAKHDSAAIATAQVAVTALFAGTIAIATGARVPAGAAVWAGLLYMGATGTAVVFAIQSWAQRHTSSTHTALIFALEPVFAALFSTLLYGEQLTVRTAIGGTLILGGTIAAELGGRRD